jgi:hypothetical protein
MPKRAGQLSLHWSTHERAVVIACRMLHAGSTMGVAAVWDVMAMAKHEHGHCIAMAAYDQFEHWRRDISGTDERAHALRVLIDAMAAALPV